MLSRLRLCLLVVTATIYGAIPLARAQTAPTLVSINYATSFGTFGRESYAFVAVELGYFREAGFDVTIRPGTGSVDGINLLAADVIDFAPIDTATLAMARAKNGVKLKLVAMIHQDAMLAT